jgi:2,4-diaminopentanoate dehydrogenase
MGSLAPVLNKPDPDQVYRVVQWATGRIGQSSLRELIRSPQFELVGVYIHSEDKDGKDAGDLCGLPPVGVTATTDIDRIIATKPDCVVAVQEGCNIDDVCRFLRAGINVATSRVDFLDPAYMDPEVRRRAEEACRAGGASIHATGCSPGFSSQILPLTTLAMSRSMESLTLDEFADIPASCPDVQVVEGMGFGRDPAGEFDPAILEHISHGFVQSLNVVAEGLGLTLEGVDVFGETAQARERFLLPGGTPIEQGTVAAQRITMSGRAMTNQLIRFRVNWYCTQDIDADWELRGNGWQIRVEGEAPIDVSVTFPIDSTRMSAAMAGITAYSVVNAVPYVCAASPGIKTTLDLPMVSPRMT